MRCNVRYLFYVNWGQWQRFQLCDHVRREGWTEGHWCGKGTKLRRNFFVCVMYQFATKSKNIYEGWCCSVQSWHWDLLCFSQFILNWYRGSLLIDKWTQNVRKALRLSNASLTRRSRKEELRERGPLCDMVNCGFARLIQCGELTPAMHFLPIARE